MLRWLFRLLVLAVIAVVGVMVVSRLTNREEDFDDYDDLEGGFDFQETPVEIEVPAEQFAGAVSHSASSISSSVASDSVSSNGSGSNGSSAASANGSGSGTGKLASLETTRLTGGDNLTDVVGIGPAFDARLKAIGISNLSDLAKADANSISEQVDVIGGVATVEDWIAQAKNLISEGTSDGNGQ